MSKNKPPEVCILVCEECMALFSWKEITPDGKWGHICKMKKYREEHRCESFIDTYIRRRK